MPDKCAKKVCPPHADGRARACNPETGRCKLVANAKAKAKAKATPKTSKPAEAVIKPKKNGTRPMTVKQILAYLESSGAYKELAKFPAEDAARGNNRKGLGHLVGRWVQKYGATHVNQKLLKKLLDKPGKKVNLVLFDFDTEFDNDLYEKANEGDFDEVVATRLKDTDDGHAEIMKAADYGGGWDDEDHPVLKEPDLKSDLVKITTRVGGEFFALVWLKTEPGSKWESKIGRYDMVFTWLT
jgi:hypothetical protein